MKQSKANPSPNLSKPRSRIAELRQKIGLTQKNLADKLGTSTHTVANWENGRVDLWFIVTVINLCKILSCCPEDLIELNINTETSSETKKLSLDEMRERLGTNERQKISLVDRGNLEDS